MIQQIGKIERVQLRTVWEHETSNFTPWLAENIEILNEILDIELQKPETEQIVGTSFVDIVTEDANGEKVIIENQLGKSDHDHLGKVITYLSAFEAKAAIWIVSDARPEHISAITWLNGARPNVSFYLLKVEAVKIGDSEPAALFTLIVGPSEESRSVGQRISEMAEQDSIRIDFWSQLLDHVRTKTSLHANLTPSKGSWLATGVGMRGLSIEYIIRKNHTMVKLYIDRGKDSEEVNKQIFDSLYKHRDKIEAVFGDKLEWDRGEAKRSSQIMKQISGGGLADGDKWSQIHERMCDTMIRFEKALRPYIRKIKDVELNAN